MSIEELTPREALEALVHRVVEHAPALAARIREAVNEGHTITEFRTGGASDSTFERTAPFTDEQALEVALRVLRIHLVEVPMFINAAHAEFALSAVASPEYHGLSVSAPALRHTEEKGHIGEPKEIVVQQRNETAILQVGQESQSGEALLLDAVTQEQIDTQLERYGHLQRVIQRVEE